MQFYQNKRSQPSVPIISLIDILAILLIFFILTTTFEKEKTRLNISLPQASEMSGSKATDRRTTIAITKDRQVFLEDREIPVEHLAAVLQEFTQLNPEAKLELKADEEIPLGFLVSVWDAFNKAGIAIRDVPARILLQNGSSP